ncbi:MAG TPA: DMT family transporter [Gemmatimonadaceae bacterium]|nr:DMT family transporter [Gemmatimonadaceae bacterium]
MPASKHDNVRGAIVMLVAVGALALMDACLKTLSPHYPAMQVTAIRGLSTLPIAVAWVALQGGFGQLRRVRFGLHLLRAALGIMMLATFTFGLRHLPLSEAYAIFFVAPLLITVFAALILGERVGAQRWMAIALGFGGMLIVLRPTGSGALTLSGFAIFACAVGYALSAIIVRVLGRTDTTPSMVFWLMLLISVGATALASPAWRPIDPSHWPVIAGVGLIGSLGQWAITEAFRRGEASFVAPLEYTALIWGVALDWSIWRTLPAPVTWVGAAVIIASGIFLIRRERVHVEAEHP